MLLANHGAGPSLLSDTDSALISYVFERDASSEHAWLWSAEAGRPAATRSRCPLPPLLSDADSLLGHGLLNIFEFVSSLSGKHALLWLVPAREP